MTDTRTIPAVEPSPTLEDLRELDARLTREAIDAVNHFENNKCDDPTCTYCPDRSEKADAAIQNLKTNKTAIDNLVQHERMFIM